MNLIVPSGSEIEPTGERYSLPQDVIDGCKEIGDRARKAIDPFQVCHLECADKDLFELESDKKMQHLNSLIVRGILPVAEVIRKEGKYYSLGIELEDITEVLYYEEVTADIILFHILFEGKYCDRRFKYDLNERKEHMNFMYKGGKFYMFDLEYSVAMKPLSLSKIDNQINKNLNGILNSYSKNKMDLLSNPKFLERIRKKIGIFIKVYDCDNGKKLFIETLKKSKVYKSDLEDGIGCEYKQYYDIFIYNLKTIQEYFNKAQI